MVQDQPEPSAKIGEHARPAAARLLHITQGKELPRPRRLPAYSARFWALVAVLAALVTIGLFAGDRVQEAVKVYFGRLSEEHAPR